MLVGVDRATADDRPAGLGQLAGDLLETDRLPFGPGQRRPVAVFDLFGFDIPQHRGPLAKLSLDIFCGLDRCQPRGVAGPAATGHVGVTDAVGVHDRRRDILSCDSQDLGQLHCHRGPGAADIARPFDQGHRAAVSYTHLTLPTNREE